MMKLTNFAMKNVAVVFILILLLIGGGTYSASSLKVEQFPAISFPFVAVVTQYNAPPSDVLDQVTKPLEKAVAGISGLQNLISSSDDNISSIFITLEGNQKPEDIKKDVESLISGVKLPDGAQKPKVMTAGFASAPIYYLAVYGENGMNQTDLDKAYKDTILPGFGSIKGIDHVVSVGNAEATMTIKLDAGALSNYGFTPAQAVGMLQSALVSSPAGTVDFNGNTEMVRIKGQINTVYNLQNMPLTTPKGDTLVLRQIAKVEAINEATYYARLSGQPAIGVLLYKTNEANAVEFAAAADKLMEGWEKTLPGVKFLSIYNQADGVKESVNGMLEEGIMGAVLASLMILLFLRNVRMTLIVLVSIPLSLLITLMLMAMLDTSLNIMTLGGMAIAIGRVVDDSIVVIENIYSQLVKRQERHESVIQFATEQVASAITSSTITTVGVFGPLAFVTGIIGSFFLPFAITIVCAILSSLLVALTVIPMLAKLLVLRTKRLPHHDENRVGPIIRRYKNIMNWTLARPKRTLLLAFLAFMITCVVTVPNLPVAVMGGDEAQKQMYFNIKMPKETSFETMDAKSKQLEQMMLSDKDAGGKPVFHYVETLVGYYDQRAFRNVSQTDRIAYTATMFAEANESVDAKKTAKEWKEKLQAELPKGSEVEGDTFSNGAPTGSDADFSYALKGDDEQYLMQAVQMVKEKMKEFPELQDIKDSMAEMKKQIEITVDENKARQYGASSGSVLSTVHSWIAEEKLGDMKFDNTVFKTKVMIDPSFKNSVKAIGDFTMKTQTGAVIKLSDIAKVAEVQAPVSISREMQSQTLKVNARIDSKDKGGVSAKVSAALNQLQLPPGITHELQGASDDIQKSFIQMFLAMGASIFIVYLIMVLAFGNASAPFAILFSLPLAAIGGLIGLLVTRLTLDATALIGFLMLIGIVVTNAIVLIDRVQQLREQGYGVREALLEAGVTRLRPIIMTAGATIIALLPLALGFSKGTVISKGLAVVVIGGLTTSTLLTLIVVPIVYEIIEAFKGRVHRMFHRNSEPAAGEKAATSIQLRG
ncbi:transporter [Gordoniibacillus kamchatkensis]|uniref:Transporter n=1 Tax=Gordoniibacillus kamchatkensis TaxID=1590651 RepID=A0ABR5AKF0_9BACL|nr:efflux RND transporter permease subunit [Paenibacillus sp. VKM B-2647]KIL41451.1 transporter [Paenibacillus sp. VKM B-2647]